MRTFTDKKHLPSVSFDHEVIRAYDLKNDPKEKKTITDTCPNPPKPCSRNCAPSSRLLQSNPRNRVSRKDRITSSQSSKHHMPVPFPSGDIVKRVVALAY